MGLPMTSVLVLSVLLVLASAAAAFFWLRGERKAQTAKEAAAQEVARLRTDLALVRQKAEATAQDLTREQQAHAASRREAEEQQQRSLEQQGELRDQLQAVVAAQKVGEERLQSATGQLSEEKHRRKEAEERAERLQTEKAALQQSLTRTEAELGAARDKLKFHDEEPTKLLNQMKVMATEVFEQTGKQLTTSQQERLQAVVGPFKETLTAFTKKVEESEKERTKEQVKLGTQLEHLMQASAALDKGAQDLTRALKGDNKVAGDWGELVLERVLEAAGLQEGREFFAQESSRDEDGKLHRPDVIVRLPEGKNLVLDSKVSLKSWTAFASDPSSQNWAEVVGSLRTHMKLLSQKDYSSLYGVSSVDFVLMFVPIEPAFLELVRQEPELMADAWDRRVMIVGPNTLQWALRVVASLWRLEKQQQNAQEIADMAGRMYDKFVGFVEEMERVGKGLNTAVDAYNGARKRLDTGRDCLLNRAQKVRELGVKSKKELPERLGVVESVAVR